MIMLRRLWSYSHNMSSCKAEGTSFDRGRAASLSNQKYVSNLLTRESKSQGLVHVDYQRKGLIK